MSDTPEIELRDANENPWYVLATVFGEQEVGEADKVLALKNRSVWNAWALSHMDDAEKQVFFDELPTNFDQTLVRDVVKVDNWKEEIERAFRDRLGGDDDAPNIPDPTAEIPLDHSIYERPLDVSGFIFSGEVYFLNAKFESGFTAQWCAFRSDCFLSQIEIPYNLLTDHSLFQSSCDLVGAQCSTLLARQTIFQSLPPVVSQATAFDDVQLTADEAYWPKFTRETVKENSKGSFVALRKMMADLHDTDMEHFFYRQEMRCVIVEEKKLLRRLPYQAFRLFSDFGHSIARPATWLGLIWFWMTSIYFAAFTWGKNPTELAADTYIEHAKLYLFSAAHSASNIVAFLGFRGLYLEDEIDKMSGWVHLLSAGQTIASFILLFLLALALRNRFRLS